MGAGASVDAGAPLMANFLDRARDWMDSESGRADRETFHRVFELISELQAIQSKASVRLHDIEEVLALFEMGVLFNRIGPRDGQAATRAVFDVQQLIVRTIESSMLFPCIGESIQPTETYRRFGELVHRIVDKGESVSVLSFNYDIGVDYGLTWNSVAIDYGLNESSNQSARVALLKLHGGINMGRCRTCPSIDVVHVGDWIRGRAWPPQTRSKPFVLLPVGSTSSTCQNCGGVREPFIVPPTWNKGQHHERVATIWRQAAAHLREAEWIIVVGYSWPPTDRFFHYLYALGTVGPTLLRRFWLIDRAPRESGLSARYNEMLGQHARDRFVYSPQQFRFSLNDVACELGLGNIFDGQQGTPRHAPSL